MADGKPRDDRELARLEKLLGEELRAALAPPAAGPPEKADRAVLAAIGQRSAEIRKGLARRRRRFRPAWAAAAAALLLAAGAWLYAGHRPGRVESKAVSGSPSDIDGSGTVDIIDAYLLARRLKGGGRLPARWDLNGDGRVDRGDVEALARRAVALSLEEG